MTAWTEYTDAARRLALARRTADAVAAQQEAAMRAARTEVANLGQALADQRARFSGIADRSGTRPRGLNPSDGDVSAALVPGSGPTAVLAALDHAKSIVDSAGAELDIVDSTAATPGWLSSLRRVFSRR